MNITFGKTSTLWFIYPCICIDSQPYGFNLEIALCWLNWQICLGIK